MSDRRAAPARGPDELHVCYQLGVVETLKRPIINRTASGRSHRVSSPRWSSVLALHRAIELRELMLETEPEWRLLETLRARGVEFTFDPLRPGLVDGGNPHGRAWFESGGERARYAGASGFVLEAGGDRAEGFVDVSEACAFLANDPR